MVSRARTFAIRRQSQFKIKVPLGPDAPDFAMMALDTGTDRPGLDKSTYKIRKAECDSFAELLRENGALKAGAQLGAVVEEDMYLKLMSVYAGSHPNECKRLKYLYEAQKRFHGMLSAWERGDIETVGAVFRADGVGLRGDYDISGPELETMCDIVRTVPGVYGERMLGGGDKGAAGCLVAADAVDAVKAAVDVAYPRSRPHLADKYAVHVVRPCDGVVVLEGLV
mmetsp:Transcript_17911/g.61818  ORF Transcript_17911/g.61818 Transcript_17911/m.61818 type:complete len:225 (+) Transcript_17911:1433-2107(+)